MVQLRDRPDAGAQAIGEALREQILAGVFGADGQLPSSRSLAQELGVSRTTVTVAFEQLRAEGFIEVRQGSRARVAPAVVDRRVHRSPEAPARVRLSAYGQQLARVAPWTDPASLIADFRHGDLAGADFPAAAWRRAVNAALEQRQGRLVYDDPRGSRRLRMALQGYLWRARSIRCELDQIVIVNGTQQGLDICARLLLEAGDRFVIEDPGYPMARQIFAGTGATATPLGVDEAGLDTAGLAGLDARLVYVTPSHQFPLGGVLSVSRRHQLLAWARQHDAYVVEDDYDSEFRYDVSPVPPLHVLKQDHRVIYLGTVSKTLSPALRLGYVVAPPQLSQAVAAAKLLMDRHSPVVDQDALARLIESGAYERHVRKARRLHLERRATLLTALQHQFGDAVTIEGAAAGLHVVAWFEAIPARLEATLIARGRQAGIGLHPISGLYDGGAAPSGRVGLVMGYAGLDPKRIERGVQILKGVVRDLLSSAPDRPLTQDDGMPRRGSSGAARPSAKTPAKAPKPLSR